MKRQSVRRKHWLHPVQNMRQSHRVVDRLVLAIFLTLVSGVICELGLGTLVFVGSSSPNSAKVPFLEIFKDVQQGALLFMGAVFANLVIVMLATHPRYQHSALDTTPGCSPHQHLSGGRGYISAATWSLDGSTLVSCSSDGTARLWDAQTGETRATFNSATKAITHLSWSPQSKLLATVFEDGTILLQDTRSDEKRSGRIPDTRTLKNISWSPDGKMLAVAFTNGSAGCLLAQTLEQIFTCTPGKVDDTLLLLREERSLLAWSPDSTLLALAFLDRNEIIIWNALTGEETLPAVLEAEEYSTSLAWSPDGEVLAIGCRFPSRLTSSLKLWESKGGKLRYNFALGAGKATRLSWSPDSTSLVASLGGNSLSVWDMQTGREKIVLQNFTGQVQNLLFSPDGLLFLALTVPAAHYEETASFVNSLHIQETYERSIYYSGICSIWRTDTWDKVATIQGLGDGTENVWYAAFHPDQPLLVTPGYNNAETVIWKLDYEVLLRPNYSIDTIHYTNAKVVLVGDSGVGKSGLALVLAGEKFRTTESTHGRHIWTLSTNQVELADGRKARGEILLWDLAGQPGYRLIHQLHLNEVTVALIVFDRKSSTDFFSGVEYWDRALRQSRQIQGTPAFPLTRFLIAARDDRAGEGIVLARLQALSQQKGFAGVFITSAKKGQQIDELRSAIKAAIDWHQLPIVNSTELFQNIKTFLDNQNQKGNVLSTADDLYAVFQETHKKLLKQENLQSLRVDLDMCIGRLEAAGSIQKLSFGNLLLLRPEILDAYASALINTVRQEPAGLGAIAEQRVRQGDFAIPGDERISDKTREALLLIAMIEDLLRHDLVLREGEYLVFPSETRAEPEKVRSETGAISITFEGPLQNIYATLAVRLTNSGLFQKQEMRKNAISFAASAGGTCGFFLRYLNEGHGELILFFDEAASQQTRFHFENYIQIHLNRYALPGSIIRQRHYTCPAPTCEGAVSLEMVRRAREHSMVEVFCPLCGRAIPLQGYEEKLMSSSTPVVGLIDTHAAWQQERQTAQSILQGKRATSDFDVFLCYDGIDKPVVKQIGKQLMERGVLPWLDEWELQPGLPWLPEVERQIARIKSAAVFVGNNVTGSWQEETIAALLREFARRRCPVIPVLLASASQEPRLPIFLSNHTWVDFRKSDPDPLEQLIWGITGKKPLVRKQPAQ